GPVEIIPGTRLICEKSRNKTRPYDPEKLRYKLFESYHGISHPMYKATKKLIAANYFWPSMATDIQHWCSSCPQCQPSKITRHVKTAPQVIDMPKKRFAHLHIDL